jgi:NAD(P)-dependent dehydrogenase (short-subunit alcohol dehydrogenase family)
VSENGVSDDRTMTKTTLITGANKGLGRETARRLLADGHEVWVAARDKSLGQATADELGARFVQLDVTDEDSVTAAAALVARATGGRLDVLINNAGIAGGRKAAGEVTADDVRRVFETNVFGVVRVTHAFLPLLERSDSPVIVNVSSGMGSIAVKAFPHIRINAVDPGYTATDLNGHNGTQSLEEGTDAIVAMAKLAPSGPTGTFVDRNGVVAW